MAASNGAVSAPPAGIDSWTNSANGCCFLNGGSLFPCHFVLRPLCVLTPVDMNLELGGQDRAFWWYLLFPTAFAAAAVAISAGHISIQFRDRISGRASGIVPWFHPTHALRDWGVIAFLFSLLYAPALYFGRELSFIGAAAETNRDWLLRRAPLLLLAAVIALFLADRFRLITRDAVLPRSPKRNGYMTVYIGWLVVSYLFIQNSLAAFVMKVPGPSLFLVAVCLASFFLLMYAATSAFLHIESRKIGPPRKGSIPATIALVGPSNAGKTVFLSRAYSLLRTIPGGTVTLEPTPESKRVVNPILDTLERDRDWPGGTVYASDIPFTLSYGMEEMIRFVWLDLPGRVFVDPDDPNYAAEVQKFESHLVNADAVAMMIDGEMLEQAVTNRGQMLNEHIYRDVAKRLYDNLKKVGSGARPVPLALVVTKTCMVHPRVRSRLRPRVHDLIGASWHLFASQAGLSAPVVKTFLSSAIITKERDQNGKPIIPKDKEPLRSEQCVEPVMWLAAQTMRANMSLMDHAAGFHGRSELQEYILRLEALAGRQ